MTDKKQIEIEFRSMFDEDKYNSLKDFLSKNAQDLGKDDKDVHFFIFPDKLLKVSDNVSKGSAKITLKLNRIGKGSNFEEIEVPINRADVGKIAHMFGALNVTDNIMHNFQTRHNYIYKGVELALKYSDIWKHHLELEVVIESQSRKPEAEKKIREVADELEVRLMTEQELEKFVEKVEKENKKVKITS